MKKTLSAVLTIIVLTLVYCGASSDKKQLEKETPKALQDNDIGVKRLGSYNGSLIDELYDELVGKSDLLKTLENDIDAVKQKPEIFREKFDNYNDKSIRYYDAANSEANAISDSLLRKKMLAVITSDSNLYVNKTKELNSLLVHIAQNETTLRDYHSVLKIMQTLPVITNYQNNNLPDKKEFNAFVNEQEKMIGRIKNATPK